MCVTVYVRVALCVSVYDLCMSVCVRVSIYVSVCMSACVCVYVSVYVSMCVFLCGSSLKILILNPETAEFMEIFEQAAGIFTSMSLYQVSCLDDPIYESLCGLAKCYTCATKHIRYNNLFFF